MGHQHRQGLFIAGLYAKYQHFPMHNWDCLIEQAEIMLNLLRPSRLNPRMTAYAQINGEFDLNRTPMAPTGKIILVHGKPHNRGTWTLHGQGGWYFRPAMLHYLCLTSHIPKNSKVKSLRHCIFPPGNTNLDKTVFKECGITCRRVTKT